MSRSKLQWAACLCLAPGQLLLRWPGGPCGGLGTSQKRRLWFLSSEYSLALATSPTLHPGPGSPQEPLTVSWLPVAPMTQGSHLKMPFRCDSPTQSLPTHAFTFSVESELPLTASAPLSLPLLRTLPAVPSLLSPLTPHRLAVPLPPDVCVLVPSLQSGSCQSPRWALTGELTGIPPWLLFHALNSAC